MKTIYPIGFFSREFNLSNVKTIQWTKIFQLDFKSTFLQSFSQNGYNPRVKNLTNWFYPEGIKSIQRRKSIQLVLFHWFCYNPTIWNLSKKSFKMHFFQNCKVRWNCRYGPRCLNLTSFIFFTKFFQTDYNASENNLSNWFYLKGV